MAASGLPLVMSFKDHEPSIAGYPYRSNYWNDTLPLQLSHFYYVTSVPILPAGGLVDRSDKSLPITWGYLAAERYK
jgi:hypothetical protein